MAGLKKQVNVNTKRMKVLMKDIRNDVYSRTKNSKSIDEWLQKLHPYVGENCLINGIHGEEVGKIIRNIVNTTEMTKLPPGANQEIVKGVMSEACMTYVTNVGKDIQTELQKIAVEGYNNKMAPKELANEMANKIDTLSKTRAQTIARTETMRANNLSNLIAAKENGAKSYTISCDDAACDLCLEVYGDEEDVVFDIDDTDNFPPLHPNCRCTPRFSTKPVEEEETTEELEDDLSNLETYQNENGITVDEMGISAEGYERIANLADTYANAPKEHGQIIDLATGKPMSPMFHGTKGEVSVPERDYVKTETCSTAHNHPPDGYDIFSPEDIWKTFNSNKLNSCVAISQEESWILETNPNTPLEKAIEIKREYKKVCDEVKHKQERDVEIRTDEICAKYSGKERTQKLREYLRYLESKEYKAKINAEMNKAATDYIKKQKQYITFTKRKNSQLRQIAKKLRESEPKTKRESFTKEAPKKIKGLSEGQQKYMDQLEKDIERLTLERDKLIKSRSPEKQVREVIGQLGMATLRKRTLTRAIENKEFSKVPSVEKQTKTNEKPKELKSKTINGKEYNEWDNTIDKDLQYKRELNSKRSSYYEKIQDKVDYLDKELHSLLDYQKNSSTAIQKLQLFGDKYRKTWDDLDKALYKNIDETIRNIKSAIDKSPGLPENTILYSGTKIPIDLTNIKDPKQLIGKTGEFKQFLSSSFDKRVAKQFAARDGRFECTILAPKGTKGIAFTEKWRGKTVNKGGGEGEFLLQSGQKFRIVDIDLKNFKCTLELIP